MPLGEFKGHYFYLRGGRDNNKKSSFFSLCKETESSIEGDGQDELGVFSLSFSLNANGSFSATKKYSNQVINFQGNFERSDEGVRKLKGSWSGPGNAGEIEYSRC